MLTRSKSNSQGKPSHAEIAPVPMVRIPPRRRWCLHWPDEQHEHEPPGSLQSSARVHMHHHSGINPKITQSHITLAPQPTCPPPPAHNPHYPSPYARLHNARGGADPARPGPSDRSSPECTEAEMRAGGGGSCFLGCMSRNGRIGRETLFLRSQLDTRR